MKKTSPMIGYYSFQSFLQFSKQMGGVGQPGYVHLDIRLPPPYTHLNNRTGSLCHRLRGGWKPRPAEPDPDNAGGGNIPDPNHPPQARILYYMKKRALLFVNGRLPDSESARRLIQPDDTLLAADGGMRHLLAFGLLPSVLIGDLDSVSADERRRLEEGGVRILQHPRDKNETDLELALHYAVEAGYRPIIVVAALGGRLDQTLGNLSLLTDPAWADIDIRLDDGVEEAFFVRMQARVEGRPGDIVSLIAWGGDVTGVATDGLRWPLHSETLVAHETRGISNEMLGTSASVRLKSGLLLVIHRH